jgi:hypothetical protein
LTEKMPPEMAPWPKKEPIPVPVEAARTELDLPNANLAGDTQCGRLKRKIAGSCLQQMPDGTMRRWQWKKR